MFRDIGLLNVGYNRPIHHLSELRSAAGRNSARACSYVRLYTCVYAGLSPLPASSAQKTPGFHPQNPGSVAHRASALPAGKLYAAAYLYYAGNSDKQLVVSEHPEYV